MKRDFKQLTTEISLKGFFSEYLPPCFKLDKRVLLCPPSEECDLVAPICFTMSRFNKTNGRRNVFIPEIGSYLVSYNYIRENDIIKELIKFSEKSKVSFSPILGTDNSIVTHEQTYFGETPLNSEDEGSVSFYIQNICKKLLRATGAKKVMKLDISNCFSSFYVHMIPSILLGYDVANDEYKKSLNKNPNINPTYQKYEKLDKIIRRQNFNQTNGLLVGPLYSKIIIESILCRIDEELIANDIKYSRYVDDYEVYIFENEEDRVLTVFEKTLKKYGFALNFEKKETVDFPFYVIENLQKIYSDASKDTLDSASLMKLFNTFLTMEQQGTKGAVRFLLKSIEGNPISTKNTNLYKSYLLSILSNDGRSLVKACSLLINTPGLDLNTYDISLIKDQIKRYITNGYDLEVIWLVYLLLQTNNAGDAELVGEICKSSNELAQVMLFFKGKISDSNIGIIKQNAKSWLLNYELYAAHQITKEEFKDKYTLDQNLPMYNNFKEKGIHFLDFS